MSSRYFEMAWLTTSGLTSPSLASWPSTATVIDAASTWKNRRAAGRVSEKPHPSVPSDANGPGTQRAIWSGTARIQSLTATTGPPWPSSAEVTYGTRGSPSGCSMFHSSQAIASRRSSVHDVADHTPASTPHSCASIRCASSADRTATPDARSCACGRSAFCSSPDGAAAYWYRPRRTSRSSAASPPG
jgi:hypothetical protein